MRDLHKNVCMMRHLAEYFWFVLTHNIQTFFVLYVRNTINKRKMEIKKKREKQAQK